MSKERERDFEIEEWRRRRFTYYWQFYNKKNENYYEYGIDFYHQKGEIFEGEDIVECIEVVLYKSPDNPPFDQYIRHSNWQLGLLVEYFKEVFNESAFIEGFQPKHKFQVIVIPPSIYHEILNVINDYQLLHIRDLLLEIIAIAQSIYIRDVAFWDSTEGKKYISSAEKEANEAIRVLEQSGVDLRARARYSGEVAPNLDYINFVFDREIIKIEHDYLKSEFINAIVELFDNMSYKDWRKQLAQLPAQVEEFANEAKFKYFLAKSYYNLFTKGGFFELPEGAKTTNPLMLCIAKLMEFSLIPIVSWEETDEMKIKHIRNWVKRNDIDPMLRFTEIPADLEKLKHYFDSSFLGMTGSIKRIDAVHAAWFICQRFDIQELLPELIHIASCIKETNTLIGHQMTSNVRVGEPDMPELHAFRLLMNGINQGGKLSSMKFIIEGEQGEHELTSRLPLYLIESALRSYYNINQIEFDSDTIPTTYEKLGDGKIKVEKSHRFNLPHERHVVRLVHSLYNYLQDHLGVDDDEMQLKNRYYAIIAVLFKETWVFYSKEVDEAYAIRKIKQWHQLSPQS